MRLKDHILFDLNFRSSIIPDTCSPEWNNEEWIVRNIPSTAKLFVVLFDKDDEKLLDDHIGQFDVNNIINYQAPDGGHKIKDIFGNNHGCFFLSIESMRSSEESKRLPKYTFDGPCRYFRHDSLAFGRLTVINSELIYSTWKIQMKRISVFFPPHEKQHWNKKYRVAQAIFGKCPISLASQTAIRVAHKALYGKTLKHTTSGRLDTADDLWKYVFTDKTAHKIKPCVYTYVIDNHTWRFSETGNRFFTDMSSKHALLANGSKYVRYAGEFHPQPKHGWDRCNDEWELVIDNGSGTYAPSADLLENLKELLSFNFPGLSVITYDFKDPKLKESREQLKAAIEAYKAKAVTVDQLVVNFPTPL